MRTLHALVCMCMYLAFWFAWTIPTRLLEEKEEWPHFPLSALVEPETVSPDAVSFSTSPETNESAGLFVSEPVRALVSCDERPFEACASKGDGSCHWCRAADRCLTHDQLCFTATLRVAVSVPARFPTHNHACAQWTTLDTCALVRMCAWCTTTQQCDQYERNRTDCHWCTGPFIFSDHLDTVAGFMSQRMKMESGFFFAHALNVTAIVTPLRSRKVINYETNPKDHSNWLDQPFSILYDEDEFTRRTQYHTCILHQLPESLKAVPALRREDGNEKPVFEVKEKLLDSYHAMTQQVVNVGHTWVKMQPFPEDALIVRTIHTAFRPNDRFRTQIEMAVAQMRARGQALNRTHSWGQGMYYGIHLRVEPDMRKAHPEVASTPENILRLLRLYGPIDGVPLYISTGIKRAQIHEPMFKPWFDAICTAYDCVLAEDLTLPPLTEVEQRYDFVALRDFGIMVEADQFWGAGWSTFSNGVAVARTLENRTNSLYDEKTGGRSATKWISIQQIGSEASWLPDQ